MDRVMSNREVVLCEVDGHFFRVGSRLVPYFTALSKGAELQRIKEMMRSELGRNISDNEIMTFLEVIFENTGVALELDAESNTVKIYSKKSTNTKERETMIWLRFPIVPENITFLIGKHLRGMFSRSMSVVMLLFIALMTLNFIHQGGATGIMEAWGGVKGTHSVEINGWLLATLMLFAYLCHEFGHCTASSACGVKPGRIGFGFYWLFPVFFADVTKVWQLKNTDRIKVDVGGVYFQSIITSIYMLLSLHMPERFVATFQIAVLYNMLSMWISLNPALRYDGYWIVADALDEPNLSKSSRNAFIERLLGGRFIKSNKTLRNTRKRETALIGFYLLSLVYSVFFVWLIIVGFLKSYKACAVFVETALQFRPITDDLPKLVDAAARALPILFMPMVLLGIFGSIKEFFGEFNKAMASGKP
ncbi:hypothetical protein [Oleiagrimonas sp. C23AA]|uniref:hypothetical protein n=1 Tax=Oleiagrimonas sp. C23AA TaxID=2719047 RepID=UPI00141EA5B1|nr:hypothetical protein [Oleiagrimonas sp. C23AA]